MSKRGKLIIFEGIDGSGKTTQSKRLCKWLNANGQKTIHTHEPEIFRNILLNEPLNVLSEVLIFLADRSEHITRIIEPALESGTNVICERWNASTLVYQKHPQTEALMTLCKFPEPDIEIYIDIEPIEAMKRIRERGTKADKYEEGGREYLEELSRRYEELIALRKMICIEAGNRSEDEIFTEILTKIGEYVCQSR